MRVLLARHGQTDWNAAAKIQGASDVPLNARGREQARSLAERVRRERVGAIYSSPLSRARETAEIIGKTLGVNVITAPELTELSFGDWEGCTWEEIGERWPKQFALYAEDRERYAPPNGESYAGMLSRAWPFVEGLRRAPGRGALCVCHSAVMRGIIAREDGLTVNESYIRLKLPNGSLGEVKSLV